MTDHIDKPNILFIITDQPVCMPNRSTIMTGRMPSSHGVIFNDRSLEWTANTHVRQFRDAGYRTGLLGKSHLQHGMSRETVRAAPGLPSSFSNFPDGWDRLEDEERYLEGKLDWPEDFYGNELQKDMEVFMEFQKF